MIFFSEILYLLCGPISMDFFWSMLVINYKGINEIDQVTMYISLLV